MVASSKDRTGLWRRKANGNWYTNDPVTGRDVSTGFRDFEAARRWRTSRERVAADPAIAAAELATLGDECRMMLDALANLGRPTKYYEHQLGHWVRLLGNDCPLSDVGPSAFDRYIRERRTEGVTNHTIDKELKCMITTLRHAKRAGRYAGALETLRPLGFNAGYVPRTRALTVPEVAALMAQLPPVERAFIALVVALGLRRGEALAIKPSDVDLVCWVVRVPGTKTAASLRFLPVLPPFRGLVAEASTHLPFGGWLRSGHYAERMAAACERAGIERCTPNDLRRTHATLLRNSGVDSATARSLLGHTRGSQLLEQVYDKPRPAELAARAGDMPELTEQVTGLAKALQSHPGTTRFPDGSTTAGMAIGAVPYPGKAPLASWFADLRSRLGPEANRSWRTGTAPPAAWSLALAADFVGLRSGGPAVSLTTARRRRKGARRAG